MSRSALLGILLAGALGVDALPARAAPPLHPYVVQAGDSCWSIAQKVLGDGRRYAVIHRYNALGPEPHLLRPGQVLRLPKAGSEPPAKVDWMRRDVQSRSPVEIDWRRAQVNQKLWQLYRVTTGTGSQAGIAFLDDSSLQLRERALLVIYGSAAVQSRVKAVSKTVVSLERGTIKGGLARLDREAALTVRTPAAEAQLRSQSSQVEVDAVRTTVVSVYQGVASVLAQGARVLVPVGQGTFVRRGSRPAPPRPLPPAPAWESPTLESVVLVPAGQRGAFDARWLPAARADRYRVELAEDARFTRFIADVEVGAGIQRFQARDLRPGTYHARVATRDAQRLESAPGPVRKVRVIELKTSRTLRPAADGSFEVVGWERLQLPADLAGELEWALGAAPFGPATEPIRLREAGTHRVRYRRRGSTAEAELIVRVLRFTGQLEAPSPRTAVGGPDVPFSLRLVDERGAPAVVHELRVVTSAGEVLPLTALAAGRFRGVLPAPRTYPGGDLDLRAEWAGGLVASVRVAVAAPPAPPPRPAPPPPPARPRIFALEAPGIEWGRPLAGLPALAAEPETFLGVSTFVTGVVDPRDTYVRLALRGALAVLDRRLALDLDLPLLDAPGNRDAATRNEVGDLRLGLRVVGLRRAGFTFGSALRVTLPTGSAALRSGHTAAELALLLSWQYRERLVLGTHQALIAGVASGEETVLHYGSAYRATVWPVRWLSLAGELDVIVGLRGQETLADVRAVAAGLSVWFHVGPGRIGLAAGAGLNDDARRTLGRFTAGLVLDLGFRGW